MRHAIVSQEEVSARVSGYIIRCVMAVILLAIIVGSQVGQQS